MTSPRANASSNAQGHAQAQNQHLSHHLADASLTPLLSSSSAYAHSEAASPKSSSPQASALTTLTTLALSAHTSASRLGLGAPLRIMVETSSRGPVILHSFVDPAVTDSSDPYLAPPDSFLDVGRMPQIPAHVDPFDAEPSPADENTTELGAAKVVEDEPAKESVKDATQAVVNGMDKLHLVSTTTTDEVEPTAPMLIGTVVADSYSIIRDARRAATRLESLAREFQDELAKKTEETQEDGGTENTEDG